MSWFIQPQMPRSADGPEPIGAAPQDPSAGLMTTRLTDIVCASVLPGLPSPLLLTASLRVHADLASYRILRESSLCVRRHDLNLLLPIPAGAMRPLLPASNESAPAAMATPAPPLKQKACVACRTRKVKCDRKEPCENCTSWKIDCNYPSPKRTCRRERRVVLGANDPSPRQASQQTRGPKQCSRSGASDERQELRDLLQRVVTLLEKSDLAQGPGETGPALLSRLTLMGGSTESSTPMLGWAQSSETPWSSSSSSVSVNWDLDPARISEQLQHLPHSDPPLQTFPFDTSKLDLTTLLLGHDATRSCWSAFLGKIDSLSKTVHCPTTLLLLQNSVARPLQLSAGHIAHVLSIYVAALGAMSDVDILNTFRLSRQAALNTYTQAAEHALMRANIMVSADWITLQALVLLVSLSRLRGESKRMWTMTGIAHRLMALQNEETSPFSEEMLARLRWKLWYIDHRSLEDLGYGLGPPDTTTLHRLPTNTRDCDMSPSMTHAPIHHQGWTEISFSLILYDIGLTERNMKAANRLDTAHADITKCEQRIQTLYLTYCDGSDPIHWLARHVSHVLIMEMHFWLHSQQRQKLLLDSQDAQSADWSGTLFSTALDILDIGRRVLNEPDARNWCWLLKAYLQFWPLRYVLDELIRQKRTADQRYAWDVVERSYNRWQERGETDSRHFEILSQLRAQGRALTA